MIRRLTLNDPKKFRQMQAVYAAAFDDAETYLGAPPSDAYVQQLLSDPKVIALVAETGAEVLGALTAYVLPKLEQARSEIYIYDLAVAEPHRRKGIATALIAELQKIAAQENAWVSFVQAEYGDDPAIALYTKLGQREEVLHFDLPLQTDT